MAIRSVKLTIDPTPEQIEIIQAHFKAAQFSYNYCLDHLIDLKEIKKSKKTKIIWHPYDSRSYQVSFYELEKRLNAVKNEIAPWNKENSQYAFTSGARNVAHDINKILARTSPKKISLSDLPQLLGESQASEKGILFKASNHGMRKNGKFFHLPKIGLVKIDAGQDRFQKLIQSGGRTSSAVLRKEKGQWILRIYVNESSDYFR